MFNIVKNFWRLSFLLQLKFHLLMISFHMNFLPKYELHCRFINLFNLKKLKVVSYFSHFLFNYYAFFHQTLIPNYFRNQIFTLFINPFLIPFLFLKISFIFFLHFLLRSFLIHWKIYALINFLILYLRRNQISFMIHYPIHYHIHSLTRFKSQTILIYLINHSSISQELHNSLINLIVLF